MEPVPAILEGTGDNGNLGRPAPVFTKAGIGQINKKITCTRCDKDACEDKKSQNDLRDNLGGNPHHAF